MYVPIWEEDRSQLDSKRVAAFAIDMLLVAPVLIPLALVFDGLDRSAWIIYAACTLTYFHVLETGSGQTVGKRWMDLRVVRADDAGPASAKTISIRTVLRLIDGLPGLYIVGLITMLVTGKRRQRLGDLAAGTVVTRASTRPYTAAERSPLVTVYPALWLGAAIALALLVGRSEEAFLARIDELCKQADAKTTALGPSRPLDQQLQIRSELLRNIANLPVPSDEARQKQIRIFQVLNTDAHMAGQILARYRETGSEDQFRADSETLVESSAEHSAQLSREFGLGHC